MQAAFGPADTSRARLRMTPAPGAAPASAVMADLPAAPLPLPDGAGDLVRRALGLRPGDALRLSYLCGPGDVSGTFEYWHAGRHDPRVPVRAYSAMFFDLVAALDAEAQLVGTHAPAERHDIGRPRFCFEFVTVPPADGRQAVRRAMRARVAQTEARVEAFDPHLVLVASDYPWWLRPSGAWTRPALLSLHNTFWARGRPGTLRAFRQRLRLGRATRKLAGAICTSSECARQLDRLTGGTVPHLTQVPQAAIRVAAVPRRQARRFFFVGRLEADKGIFDLVDAFATTRATMPGATLRIAGYGGAEEALTHRLAEIADARIAFLGRLSGPEVHANLGSADVLLCPTRSRFLEGLAMTCLEAAQHAVPSIVSDVVPAADLLGEGCIEVPADSPARLAGAMQHLHDNDAAFAAASHAAAAASRKMYDPCGSWAMCLYRLMAERDNYR